MDPWNACNGNALALQLEGENQIYTKRTQSFFMLDWIFELV